MLWWTIIVVGFFGIVATAATIANHYEDRRHGGTGGTVRTDHESDAPAA